MNYCWDKIKIHFHINSVDDWLRQRWPLTVWSWSGEVAARGPRVTQTPPGNVQEHVSHNASLVRPSSVSENGPFNFSQTDNYWQILTNNFTANCRLQTCSVSRFLINAPLKLFNKVLILLQSVKEGESSWLFWFDKWMNY